MWVFVSVYMSVSDSVYKCSCVGTREDVREQLEQADSLLSSYGLVHLAQVIFLEASCLELSHHPLFFPAFFTLRWDALISREVFVVFAAALSRPPPEKRKQDDAMQVETWIENWLNTAFNIQHALWLGFDFNIIL